MSPVHDLAPRFRELGRLKFGEDLGDRPGQLKTWRLVSPDPSLIDAAATIYGGAATRRYDEVGAELVTETSELSVLIPAQDVAGGQWFELWGAGGLVRRCTGFATVDVDHAGDYVETGPCQCDPAARACKLRTVLRVLLPELPDLGVWRLSTGSLYAAAELPPAVEALRALNPDRALVPAVLGLEERTTKRRGQPPNHYVVPVLRTVATLAELLASASNVSGKELGAGSVPSPGPLADPASAQNATTAPESPQIGPEAPELDQPDQDPRKRPTAALVAAARFLAETEVDASLDFAELLAILDRLEALMVAAAIWKRGAVDAAAAKAGLPDAWRAGTLTADVRTLTTRAVLGALTAITDHPDGAFALGIAQRSDQ